MIDLNQYSKSELSMLQIQIKQELQKRRREEQSVIEDAINKFHTAYTDLIALIGKSCVMYKSNYSPCAKGYYYNGGVVYLTDWNDFIFDYDKEQ